MSKIECDWKKLLSVVHSLNKFRNYITSYQIFVHNGHTTIKYLTKKPDVNAKVIRWLLLLQQFDITINDKPSRENAIADFLSRLAFPVDEEEMVDDQLLDDNLFPILVPSLWFVDIANYLVATWSPPRKRAEL